MNPAQDYVFRFDRELPRTFFGSDLALTGWHFRRDGKPINGLRAVVRRPFFRKKIFRARRKRNRPDAAAAFPENPEAAVSGFLLEMQLHLGRNLVRFEVLDHERRWQTLAQTSLLVFPLAVLERAGFTRTRRFLGHALQRRFTSNSVTPVAPGSPIPSSPGPPQTKRIELFATSKSNLFMLEIGELVAAGFREIGCEAALRLNEIPALDPATGTLQIVVAPHEYHHLFLSDVLPRAEVLAVTQQVCLLCTEQPETGWFQSSLTWARHSLGVADLHPLGMAAYRAHGIPAQQLALGYHPLLAHAPLWPTRERRYDVVFLGSMTPRREEFIARHADFFVAHECHLRLVPLEFAKTAESRSYLQPAQRNELLSQARILLNVHHGEQRYLEWHRMLVGLANGCCVITESCEGYGALVPGRHFVMVEPEHLIAACEYYLAHPAECQQIAESGRRFIEMELRQAQACAGFLRSFEQGRDRAAPPPPDAAAVALPAELRRKISRTSGHLLWRALREDLSARRAAPSRAAPQQPERSEIIARREGYQTRLQQQNGLRASGGAILELHQNNAFSRSADPKLTVLITLYNYAPYVEACVASAAAAIARLGHRAEIVIVNDGSSDGSFERAEQCLRRSELPLRIVDKKFNTGLADARNTGLEFARAPFVFMMDADNLLFPDALRQLFAVMTAEDYAAAYSLLCRFRGRPENRIGLLSAYDWDPQILVQYPYIDAMAMFRRDDLLELGGYDSQLSQIGWFGWEDYDMWLRFAQRDLRVGFVPNTLCLYRSHEASMIHTTNLFQMDLVRHFGERYGDLLARFTPQTSVFGADRAQIAGYDAAEPRHQRGGNASSKGVSSERLAL
ncbi:MAG: glycosyltransferase [Chthoniobacterales bacterium]